MKIFKQKCIELQFNTTDPKAVNKVPVLKSLPKFHYLFFSSPLYFPTDFDTEQRDTPCG